VSPRTDLKSRIAQTLAAHAVRVAEPGHAEWAMAMMHEQEHLPPDASVLSWALGCVSVSYRGRLRTVIRLPNLLRWVGLLAIFIVCLGPPCWNFNYIAVSTAQGSSLFPGAHALPYTALQAALLFGSATLIGPIGVAAALWTLSSRTRRPGTILMVVLWTLTAWALWMVSLPAQYPLLTHMAHVKPVTQILTLLLNFVFLPSIGVALLQLLDTRRRRLAI
jgi:hypothetical protein